MYVDWKILKSEIDEKAEEYSQVAEWCNNSGEYYIELYIDENNVEWYRTVKNPEPTPPTEEEIKAERIAELKALLASTDYVVIKIAEGVATAEDYADVIAQRQAWREEINRLGA